MNNPVHDRIRERLADLNLRPGTASQKSGLSRDFLRSLLKREDALPRSDNLTKLAAGLETSEQWLMHGRGPKAATANPVPPEDNSLAPAEMARAIPQVAFSLRQMQDAMPPDVPVYGTAAGSLAVRHEGAWEMETRVIEYVRRPPALLSVADAYAIYVSGSSMWPEHKPGELRFVHPHRPPRHGDPVVVQARYNSADGIEAFVGSFQKWTADHLVITKLNPASEVRFNAKTVEAVHRILTMNELFGV